MPIATVNDAGLQFFYEDTGPLDHPYLTIVLVHGTGFHTGMSHSTLPGHMPSNPLYLLAGIFRRLLPHAAPNNVRLILVNRRDYPRSTPFSSVELAALSSEDVATRTAAIRQHGLQMGAFLACIRLSPLCRDIDGKTKGGMAFVAWSLSHTAMSSLISCADMLPVDESAALEPYLRAYCAFNSPYVSFGLQSPSSYHPLTEVAVPEAERVPRFNTWVSAYHDYTPNAAALRDPALLDMTPLPYPTPVLEPGTPIPTLDAMSPSDLESVVWHAPIQSSELFIFTLPLEVNSEHTRRTLFDKECAKIFPECRFVLLYGEKDSCQGVGAAWTIEKMYDERKAKGEVGRPLEVVEMPEANHFPHWDQPEKTMSFFASIL
ncbi:hypothetical protein OF83DRAFT_1068806 [Amylostereum chailletii]|nr:hypothetical protein OF83DRAFT_1068806 [Amylostereum chailletii]